MQTEKVPDVAEDPTGSALLTVKELHEFLRISETAARRLIDAGEVDSLKFGHRTMVSAPSVLSYIERCYRSGSPEEKAK